MKFKTIHTDKRGSIGLLEGDMSWPEVTVFITNPMFARGGCIHKLNQEFVCVIEGEILYNINNDYMRLRTGQTIVVPKDAPHYFISMTKSIVLEWGATPEEKAEKHPEFRKVVEEFNDTPSGAVIQL